MRRNVILMKLVVLSMAIMSNVSSAANPAVWQRRGAGIYEPAVFKIAVDPRDPSLIFAATARALYRSSDGGESYRAVFQAVGINDIHIAPSLVFMAGDDGLYISSDAGGRWQRSYHSSDEDAKACRSVIEQDGIFYLGTAKGLWTKSAHERNWRRVEGALGQAPIEYMKVSEGRIYIATDRGVFRWDIRTGGYEQVFGAGIGQSLETDGGNEEDTGRAEGLVHSVEVAGRRVFIAASRGLYVSADDGQTWERLATDGLPLDDLTALLVTEDSFTSRGQDSKRPDAEGPGLLVGTKKGAFLFKDGGWRPVYEGMETNGISHLAKDARNTVYAATDRGVFHLTLNEALPSLISATPAPDLSGVQRSFEGEPTIGDVHHLAIAYAEVGPEKITRWRRLAQKRAWLPDVSIGLDGARDWSKSSSIWGSYTSGGQHYVGPDDKARGGDLGWDVSLSWDLGDVVWTSEQTSIDSRSKLMVELREDILDQVTRLYFERRRIQTELAAAGTLDTAMKTDKELRVAELTALLDAFTGGQFSRRIHSN